MHNLKLTASVVSATRRETTVTVECGALQADVVFHATDACVRGTHAGRATRYVALVAGTRDLAATIVALADAEVETGPRTRIGIQWLASLAALSQSAE
jgi:hypothetical protein